MKFTALGPHSRSPGRPGRPEWRSGSWAAPATRNPRGGDLWPHASGRNGAAAPDVPIWRERRDLILRELQGYPLIPPHGGWSLLVDCAEQGLAPQVASTRLFELGGIAATAMDGWGPSGERYLRLVFANEPVDRLAGIRERFDAALTPL